MYQNVFYSNSKNNFSPLSTPTQYYANMLTPPTLFNGSISFSVNPTPDFKYLIKCITYNPPGPSQLGYSESDLVGLKTDIELDLNCTFKSFFI